MKYTLLLAALCSATLTCCQNSLPPVPENDRQVVRPKGSSDIEKPWGGITPKEGDAVLGPLSNMRR